MKTHLIMVRLPYLILIAVCLGNYLAFGILSHIDFPSHLGRLPFVEALPITTGLCQKVKSLTSVVSLTVNV